MVVLVKLPTSFHYDLVLNLAKQIAYRKSPPMRAFLLLNKLLLPLDPHHEQVDFLFSVTRDASKNQESIRS